MGDRVRGTPVRGERAAVLISSVFVMVATFVAPGPVAAASAADGDGFRNGEAAASAQTFTLNVKQGNANIGFTYGSSIANYRDTTGTADAKALDLGVLSTLFGVEQCDGSPAILNPATFPPSTRTDSTHPTAPTSRIAEAFQPGLGTNGPGPLAGTQDATATKQPSSRATTNSERADLYLLAVDGGATEARTTLSNGVREAYTLSTARELRVFGGLFTFVEPRWEATARTGATTTTTGSFTFERATVLGSPRTPAQAMADLSAFRTGLEQLLAPFGVRLELPALEIDGGRVRVTPMSFKVRDMPWGNKVVAPFLGQVQPWKEALTRQLLDEDCKNESSLLVADVLLGILGGSGSIELDAGGVEAWTADTDFSSPELLGLPADGVVATPATPAEPAPFGAALQDPVSFDEFPLDDLPFDDLSLGDPALDDLGPDGFTTDEVALDGGAPEAEVASSTDERDLEVAPVTAVARFEDGTAGRAAVAVGLIGLLGALGLSAGERLRSRRTTRRIP